MSIEEKQARAEVLAFAASLGLANNKQVREALLEMGHTKTFETADKDNVMTLLRRWKDKQNKDQKVKDILEYVDQPHLVKAPYKVRDWNKLKNMFVKYPSKEVRDAQEAL